MNFKRIIAAASLVAILPVSACTATNDVQPPQPTPTVTDGTVESRGGLSVLADAFSPNIEVPKTFGQLGENVMSDPANMVGKIAISDIAQTWIAYAAKVGVQPPHNVVVAYARSGESSLTTRCTERNIVDGAPSETVDPVKSGIFFCAADGMGNTSGTLYVPLDYLQTRLDESPHKLGHKVIALYALIGTALADAYLSDIQKYVDDNHIAGLEQWPAAENSRAHYVRSMIFGYCMAATFAVSFQGEFGLDVFQFIPEIFGDPTGVLTEHWTELTTALADGSSPGFCIEKNSPWAAP